jgi:acyl-coenzyme A thioesterase PaaI-like protein
MSKAVRAAGHTAMTASLEIDYHRPVPSGALLRLEGRLLSSERRKHRTEARILDGRGHLLASAKGLFVEVKPRRMQPAS